MNKLTKACLGLAVCIGLALAPAAALASPALTHPTGKFIVPGVFLRATNVGVTKLTLSNGTTVECSSTTMTGLVRKNEKEEIEWEIETGSFTGTGTGGACTSTGGLGTVTVTPPKNFPWCMRAGRTIGVDNFELRSKKCSEPGSSMTFAIDSALGECKYEGVSIKGSLTTDVSGQDAVLDVSENQFTGESGNPLTCPGAAKLDMSLTLETDNSTMAEPIYIS